MFHQHSEIFRKIFIALIVILLCTILFLVLLLSYFYYSRRRKLPDSSFDHRHSPERIEENSPKLIEELMRKSFELAQTAEQVADRNEKTLIIQDNIHTHF